MYVTRINLEDVTLNNAIPIEYKLMNTITKFNDLGNIAGLLKTKV